MSRKNPLKNFKYALMLNMTELSSNSYFPEGCYVCSRIIGLYGENLHLELNVKEASKAIAEHISKFFDSYMDDIYTYISEDDEEAFKDAFDELLKAKHEFILEFQKYLPFVKERFAENLFKGQKPKYLIYRERSEHFEYSDVDLFMTMDLEVYD